MSERAMNLLTNPYTWVLFIFVMLLPYILKYIRRFYPESLREKMEKEEACTLEYQENPKVQMLYKIIQASFFISIFVSYLTVYHLFDSIENKFKTAFNLFVGIMSFIVIVGVYFDYKLSKDKNCNDVIVGYKYLKFPNVIVTIVVSSLAILGIFYLIGIMFPPQPC